MKTFLFIVFIFALTVARAQTPAIFNAGVAFNSICCGPPEEGFLKAFMKNKEFKRIKAYEAAGCGREGEFRILFSFKGVKSAVSRKFLKSLQAKVAKQDAINKAKNASSGTMELLENIKKEDLANCKSGIHIWKL